MPLMEDTEFMKRLKNNGWRIGIINKPALSSARKWETGGIFRNTLKNHVVRFLYWIGTAPATLEKIYYGK